MREFKNRKAEHDYFFTQEFEAGIVLKGTEVKSIRAGKVNFKDSFARIDHAEIWLYNLHISCYKQSSIFNHDPERRRKLLLNKKEIKKISKQIEERGFTLIPKNIFINENNLVKVTLAIAKGKKKYDKRQDIKRKDELRNIKREKKYTNVDF